MVRSIIAVVAGVIIGVFAVMIVETVGHALFAPPVGADAGSGVAALPVAVKASVLCAWFVGAFAGGVVASLVARRWAPAAWVVATTILLFAATAFSATPHPLWMMLSAVPATLLGGFLAVRASKAVYGRPPSAPSPGTGR